MSHIRDQRPLSPHLSIYRWLISNTLSILHRITGFGLSLGLIPLTIWLWSAAYDLPTYIFITDLFGTLLGKLALFCWTLAYYYHLGNGMRHLNWDIGRGFTLPAMAASGRLVVVFAIAMSILTWAMIRQKAGL